MPMPTLIDTIEGRRVDEHRPWPRLVVSEDGWRRATEQLAAGRCTLWGLWGDVGAVSMALLDEGERAIVVVTLQCPGRHFPSVGAMHAPAIRPERALRDLYGIEPDGSPDPRPWLDLGFWDVGELQFGVVSDHLYGFHRELLVLVLVNCGVAAPPSS